jgi:hypothetical protein
MFAEIAYDHHVPGLSLVQSHKLRSLFCSRCAEEEGGSSDTTWGKQSESDQIREVITSCENGSLPATYM